MSESIATMTPEEEAAVDWSLCTWEGSRRQQHEEFRALSFQRKMEIVEDLSRFQKEALELGRRAREIENARVVASQRPGGSTAADHSGPSC